MRPQPVTDMLGKTIWVPDLMIKSIDFGHSWCRIKEWPEYVAVFVNNKCIGWSKLEAL